MKYLLIILTICNSCIGVSQQYKEDLSLVRPKMPEKVIDYSFFENKENESSTYPKDSLLGKEISPVIIDKIDSLAKKLDEYEVVSGWRVQIYSGTNLQEASSIRKEVITFLEENIDGDIPEVYQNYDGTNIRIKIGDYIEKLRAYRILVLIKGEEGFERSLLVPDRVYLDKID